MSEENPATNGSDASSTALIGIAELLRRSFQGVDLGPLGQALLARAESRPDDANALLDLSTVLQINGNPDVAMAIQAQALQNQQCYHLPAKGDGAGLRLLAIKSPGALMANTPLEFLIEDANISLDLLYLSTDLPVPESIPDHDVLFVAVGESDQNQPLLAELAPVLESWPRPVLNRPERIAQLSRDGACARLEDVPGLIMPEALRVSRAALSPIASGESALGDLEFPIIIRPVGSHAGHGLSRIESPAALAEYLNTIEAEAFYLSPFIDYSGEDGLFRKYRIVLVDGRPFPVHMAISEHWMVHYLNAGMTESEAKRLEEARFMEQFDEGFASRHAEALDEMTRRLGLDYYGIDCAETPDGELLVFEADSALVIHAMDPPELFPYKHPAMEQIFTAFQQLLEKAKASA